MSVKSKFNDDARFEHVSYIRTDLRQTFARIRREMRVKPAVVRVPPIEVDTVVKVPDKVVNINKGVKHK